MFYEDMQVSETKAFFMNESEAVSSFSVSAVRVASIDFNLKGKQHNRLHPLDFATLPGTPRARY